MTDEKEIKSNRAWREECEALRARVAELEALKASQGELLPDGTKLYTAAPTIPEGYLLAEKACREFIRKVENAEARSTRSYAAMKRAINLIDAIGWSTQKKWGE